MSFWIYGRRKHGKETVTSVSIPLELVLVFLGMLFFMFLPGIFAMKDIDPSYRRNVFLVAAGFLVFATAKILQFQRGIWVSWGMQRMPLLGKLLYVSGYMAMGLGIMFLIVQF